MSFIHCRELISVLYPSSGIHFTRIENNSNIILRETKSFSGEDNSAAIRFLVGLIPKYMLEGLASEKENFLDKAGLDRMIGNLEKVHLIKIIPHKLPKNVSQKQGLFMISGYPDRYDGMSFEDTITLDYLTEFGNYMIPFTDYDFDTRALWIMHSMKERGLSFDETLIRDGLKFIKRSVADNNAMSVFLSMKHMDKRPFLFSASEYTCLFAKALDFIDDSNCSDSCAMGRLSESLFRGDFLDCLESEIDKKPIEIVTMLSILGKVYNAVYGDGSNIGEALKYYSMLKSILTSIKTSKGKKPYTYK